MVRQPDRKCQDLDQTISHDGGMRKESNDAMNWSDQVFRYCERMQDPSFWAEPFNALSNIGFLLVAAWSAYQAGTLSPNSPRQTADTAALAALIALAFAIGIGSFLFHTFATRWSRLADVAPIALFMMGYLGFALRVYLGCSARQIAAALAVFVSATAIAASIACPTQLTSVATFSREPCLKGTMGYAPALVALILTGILLHRRHPAGRALLLAAGIFLTAMLLRWLDSRSCAMSVVFGRPRGTHALWHVLNAATIYVLLSAAIAAIKTRCNAGSGDAEPQQIVDMHDAHRLAVLDHEQRRDPRAIDQIQRR